jgi:hypothetical protein
MGRIAWMGWGVGGERWWANCPPHASCVVAVVTGGAIVADEVIEQVEGGGDGLF